MFYRLKDSVGVEVLSNGLDTEMYHPQIWNAFLKYTLVKLAKDS